MSEMIRIIPFEEIKKIPLEELVNNRVLQRDIHYSLYLYANGGRYQRNPNPIIKLEIQNSGERVDLRFRINDKENLYFFEIEPPNEVVPSYLKEDDVIGSGRYTYTRQREDGKWGNVEIPFNKPLNRVKKNGGIAERYNSREGQWEQYLALCIISDLPLDAYKKYRNV